MYTSILFTIRIWAHMTQKIWRKDSKNHLIGDDLNHLNNYDSTASNLFSLKVPKFLKSKINFEDKNDPLLLQVMPHKNELIVKENYLNDPVGDLKASKSKGIIHKYHGRVLLITNGQCAVNCRYCFRRNFPYKENYATQSNWQSAVNYIKNNSDIHEVILSGGDPLMLSTKVLTTLSEQLEMIKHLKTLRIHTRIPLVTPSRITEKFVTWLDNIALNKVMVLHCNHPQELDNIHKEVFKSIRQTATLLLNQSVLLKNINDDAEVLSALSHKLFSYGVLPYYLNQLDKATGTSHFKVSNKRAKSIHKQVLAQLPGYLVPKLVREIKGKLYKSPLF